jgi:hypothetical protein
MTYSATLYDPTVQLYMTYSATMYDRTVQLYSEPKHIAVSTLLSQFVNVNDICVLFHWVFPAKASFPGVNTVMRRIMTFRSTMGRIYDGGPIRL